MKKLLMLIMLVMLTGCFTQNGYSSILSTINKDELSEYIFDAWKDEDSLKLSNDVMLGIKLLYQAYYYVNVKTLLEKADSSLSIQCVSFTITASVELVYVVQSSFHSILKH